MLACFPFWFLAFQLGMNYVAVQDTLAHRLIKKCTRKLELERLNISLCVHNLPDGALELSSTKRKRPSSWTDRQSPKANEKKKPQRTSYFDDDAGSMTGVAIDELVEEQTKIIVDIMAPTWRKRKMIAILLVIPLSIMCPGQRVYYYGQPFLGDNGFFGQCVAALSIAISFIVFSLYFIQCISVAQRFSKVRWHMRIFTALLSEEDSSFFLKGTLIEMPFLNL